MKLSVEISYLVGAQTEKNDLPFAPKVHISTDAQNVKEFTFSSDVKATTKKWVTFSGDITCDLGDTVGNKIEWAYITLFAPGETDISVYVDDIKISGENGVLLEQGFEDFDESATVEDIAALKLNLQQFKACMADTHAAENERLQLDLEFHHMLGIATHNGFMERVYAFAMNYFRPYLIKTYEAQAEIPMLSIKSHEELLRLLEEKNREEIDEVLKKTNTEWAALANLEM